MRHLPLVKDAHVMYGMLDSIVDIFIQRLVCACDLLAAHAQLFGRELYVVKTRHKLDQRRVAPLANSLHDGAYIFDEAVDLNFGAAQQTCALARVKPCQFVKMDHSGFLTEIQMINTWAGTRPAPTVVRFAAAWSVLP